MLHFFNKCLYTNEIYYILFFIAFISYHKMPCTKYNMLIKYFKNINTMLRELTLL